MLSYIAFNMFLDPARLMPAFEARSELSAIGWCDRRSSRESRRIGIMAMGLAGWFIDKPGQRLGTMYTRATPLNFVVNPRLLRFAAAWRFWWMARPRPPPEIFAGGMRDLKRARVFGTQTAGQPCRRSSSSYRTGTDFSAPRRITFRGWESAGGIGVAPDVIAPPTRELLLAGRDAALESALHWIHTK
jgi:carboxyl-terminal processing protease